MAAPIYRGNHDRIRRELLAAFVEGTPCPICKKPMSRSQKLHLGHLDDNKGYSIPGRYVGLVHGRCNMSHGGKVNPWNNRAKSAAAAALRPPERQRELDAAKSRREFKAGRAAFDEVQRQIANGEI